MAIDSNELGAFLRARRARIRPGEVGLPAGVGVRRTPGLRREELAAIAGVSVEYLTRLEQGRETNPSTGVLDALATALLLDHDAHAHLYELANSAAKRTPPAAAVVPESDARVRPAVEQLLEQLRPSPAYVLNRISNVVAANPEAVALFAGLDQWPRERWNTIRYVFLHPQASDLFADWQSAASSGVANLRAALGTPIAEKTTALIQELRDASSEFVRLWDRYDVQPRRSHPKTFNHPEVGTITLHHEVLYLSDDGLRLAIYQADPTTENATALTLLALSAANNDNAKRHQRLNELNRP